MDQKSDKRPRDDVQYTSKSGTHGSKIISALTTIALVVGGYLHTNSRDQEVQKLSHHSIETVSKEEFREFKADIKEDLKQIRDEQRAMTARVFSLISK